MGASVGIDYGDSRIGIAVGDSMGIIASPRCVVDGTKGLKNVLEEITKIVKEINADTVVIGYPKNMDGSEGFRIQRTEKFLEKFTEAMPEVKIIRWDERLTTVAANRAMLEMGVAQKRKGISDMIAAQMILQGWLDSVK